jgi:3-oxoacyl-[acyl-carrier protein] reductase
MTSDNASAPLAGTAAIVTGSARRLGRAIALALAEAGAAVTINARSDRAAAERVAAAIRDKGGRAAICMADVTNRADADRLIAEAVAAFGRLDILVNNVGMRKEATVEETSDDHWRAVMATMLDSTFFCTRAAVPHLAKNDHGTIVNIGGMAGHAGIPQRCAIATAKAGIAGFTGSLAIELAPRNITVNCVAPSFLTTEEDAAVPPHIQRRTAPLGRHGTAGEVAATVAFLCGPGGRYITGQTLHVNGGWYVSIG